MENLQGLLDRYRSLFSDSCSKSIFDVYTLFKDAKTIQEEFEKLILKIGKNLDTLESDKRSVKLLEIQRICEDDYPRFIPAFTGFFGGFRSIFPSAQTFQALAEQGGDNEDKLFFRNHRELGLTSPAAPWVDLPAGSPLQCVRFGDYPWEETLKRLIELEGKFTKPFYKEITLGFKDRIVQLLSTWKTPPVNSLCACKAKTDVERDFKALRAFTTPLGNLFSLKEAVVQTLARIQRGEIEIQTIGQNNCGKSMKGN